MKHFYILAFIALAFATNRAGAQGLFSYNYDVISLGGQINSPENDYAPFLSVDRTSLYFTSYRDGNSLGEADIFLARRDGTGWAEPVNPGSPLNGEGNDGSFSITTDGRTVVFAADDRDDGFGDTDIYIAELADGRLTGVRNLGRTVNTKHWDSQPVITGDGQTIYFSSNRRDGTGGTDIYITHRNADGTWSQAVNAGPEINTKKNERSPYLTPDGGALYFSSDGIAGFGGYDIFMSMREGNAWGQPANLGSLINSEDDELFFFAPSKTERFYFASSRRGGMGGLDLYYGTPNVFGDGMFRLSVSVLDSSTNAPLPGVVSIVDITSGDTISTFFTNTVADEYEQILPAGRRYRIVSRVRDQEPRTADITGGNANSEQDVIIRYGAFNLAEFDLGRYNIPFFVTGYYRPNTERNLEELFPMLKGMLSDASYIERFGKGTKRHNRYKGYAQKIDSLFSAVRSVSLEQVFPRFKQTAGADEVLEITITGYADPQQFVGDYVESDEITFEDKNGARHTLAQGERIGNLELSGLRAWHSARELDRIFTEAAANGHPEYRELMDAGKIRYRYIGGGESRGSNDYAAQRRIHISISRVGGDSRLATEFDVDRQMR